MKVAFILDKFNYYRFYSTLIIELRNRNISFDLIHLSKLDLTKQKVLNTFLLNNNLEKYSKVITLKNFIELKNHIMINNYDFFISLNPVSFNIENRCFEKITKRWCILMHGDDNYGTVGDWNSFSNTDKLEQNYERFYFVYNKYMHNFHLSLLKRYPFRNQKNNYKFFESDKTKIIETGEFSTDLNIIKLEENKFLINKYNPENKKVILYLPFPFNPLRQKNSSWEIAFSGFQSNIYKQKKDNNPKLNSFVIKIYVFFLKIYYFCKIFSTRLSIHYFINKFTEKNLLKKLYKFSKKNNAILIIKARKKFPILNCAEKFSDYIYYEDNDRFYPSILQELISVSEIVIGYYTTAIKEIAPFKKKYINIDCPEIFFDNRKDRIERHRLEEYNYEGVVKNIDIKNFINSIENLNLNYFKTNVKKFDIYLKKYLGLDNNFKASKKLVDFLIKNHENSKK